MWGDENFTIRYIQRVGPIWRRWGRSRSCGGSVCLWNGPQPDQPFPPSLKRIGLLTEDLCAPSTWRLLQLATGLAASSGASAVASKHLATALQCDSDSLTEVWWGLDHAGIHHRQDGFGAAKRARCWVVRSESERPVVDALLARSVPYCEGGGGNSENLAQRTCSGRSYTGVGAQWGRLSNNRVPGGNLPRRYHDYQKPVRAVGPTLSGRIRPHKLEVRSSGMRPNLPGAVVEASSAVSICWPGCASIRQDCWLNAERASGIKIQLRS